MEIRAEAIPGGQNRMSKCLRQGTSHIWIRTQAGWQGDLVMEEFNSRGSTVSPEAASPPLRHKVTVTPGQGTEQEKKTGKKKPN